MGMTWNWGKPMHGLLLDVRKSRSRITANWGLLQLRPLSAPRRAFCCIVPFVPVFTSRYTRLSFHSVIVFADYDWVAI